MVGITLNILSALIFPLTFPLLAELLSKVNIKPVDIESKNGIAIIKNDIPLFFKELPTAYLSNIFWVFTVSINDVSSKYLWIWMIYCILMLLVQVFIILYVYGAPNKRRYFYILQFFGVLIFIFSLIRLDIHTVLYDKIIKIIN
jgi:hypothetical protein